MKSLMYFGVLCALFSEILSSCFQEQPLDSSLQEYLKLNKSCADTLFPQPSCCGVSKDSGHRIINGTVTDRMELTWTVYVAITEQNTTSLEISTFGCGGSLINPRWVISAAHCFLILNTQIIKTELHLGEWNLTDVNDSKVVRIPADKVEIHPNYKRLPSLLGLHDLALLRMERSVAYTDFINPICLPFTPITNDCFGNQEAVVTGWGHTTVKKPNSTNPKSPSPVKLKTTLSVWNAEKCKHYETNLTLHGSDYICASSDDTNSGCSGDSGGPLSLKLPNNGYYYLLGVVSGGSEHCNNTEHPNIYTNVNLKWILNVILNDNGVKHN